MSTAYLAPADGEHTSALRMLRSSAWISRGGYLGAALLLGLPVLLAFVPWQQNIVGGGRVAAFAPLDRQQSIEAPLTGRVVAWYVQEGAEVVKDDPLLEMSDIDPGLIDRLERERTALLTKLTAAESKLAAYEVQVQSLTASRDLSVAAVAFRLETASEKIRAAQQEQIAADASRTAAEAQYERMRRLLDDGIASRREFEVAERDFNIARTAETQAAAGLRAAEAERASLERVMEDTRASAEAKIASARALAREAESQLADGQASLTRLETRLSRQQSQTIRAPRDGTVLRLLGNEGGEIVRQGDPLLVLVPKTDRQAVELWVSGNDAPLIEPGRSVRLQFEGWPAIQFAGWPAVAVGTFGGRVALVDASDDGQGRFRLLVVPDPSEPDWPEQRFLRQGVRAKGWVLLEQVPLGYEFWRQLNGFPPSVQPPEPQRDLARKRIK